MKRSFIPLLAGVFVLFSCPVDGGKSVDPARLVRSGIPEDLIGMVHAGGRSEVAEEYALLDEMGVEWMLIDFSWSSIQPARGTWNLGAFDTYADNAKTHGKKILAILDYDTSWLHEGKDPKPDGPLVAGDEDLALFCKYVKKTVEYYKNRVDAWCIWNEPNLQPRFWATGGTKEQFFALTKAAAAAIRNADADAFIVGGAFNTLASDEWVRGIFTSGTMDQINAIAYHPYMPAPDLAANIYKRFQNIVSDYGFGNKIWITEVGYPTRGHYGTEVDEDQMPETVMQTIVLLAAEGAERVFWYELFDHGGSGNPDDAEHWFGLVNGDMQDGKFQKKKGAAAYGLCALNIPGKNCKIPEREGLPSSIKTYYFEGGDGSHALVVWNGIAIPRDVGVYLPGGDQKVYNLESGNAESIPETSNYTLTVKDQAGSHYMRFFTWKNADLSRPPRVSLR
jgi:hypothetical protein